ncbi:MAG TPA: hypothetical protein VJU82_14410 [Acidobacteriaceae bacterium]|nr:hypothetical protein [Acidobacteriaceae bacterium]
MALDLVGMAEITAMLGVSRQRAYAIAHRPDFPEPQAVIKAGAIWLRADVERWIAEHPERPPGRPRRHPEAE